MTTSVKHIDYIVLDTFCENMNPSKSKSTYVENFCGRPARVCPLIVHLSPPPLTPVPRVLSSPSPVPHPVPPLYTSPALLAPPLPSAMMSV